MNILLSYNIVAIAAPKFLTVRYRKVHTSGLSSKILWVNGNCLEQLVT